LAKSTIGYERQFAAAHLVENQASSTLTLVHVQSSAGTESELLTFIYRGMPDIWLRKYRPAEVLGENAPS
jgi:hypothetical protein